MTVPEGLVKPPREATGAPPDANDPKPSPCLVCGSDRVREFLDLGRTALANRFLTGEELDRPEIRYPLRMGLCPDCGHVQLTDRVPPGEMFTEYLYMSSASETLNAHFADLSETLIRRHALTGADLVVDIGCNDEALLRCFRRHGIRTLGVDPATNLAQLTAGSAVDRFVGYFGSAAAFDIVARWGQASLITATNTFPHIHDLRDFMLGIQVALAPGGAFVIECHYLLDLLDSLAFDTVYHEHVSYWSLRSLVALVQMYDMEVVDAERLPLHHGQIRVTVRRAGEAVVHRNVSEVLEREHDRGGEAFATYQAFADRADATRRELRTMLLRLKGQGRRLAGYGAPAKASTLLELLHVGPDVLDFIVDRSPLKQGRYTPGTHIPIVSPERLLADPPDYVLLLAWNFVEEILAQQASYREGGGRFILPVPEVRVL